MACASNSCLNSPQHPIFQPFMFFDLTTGRQQRLGGGSLSNAPEAQLAVNLYLTLKRAFGGFGPKGSGDENGIVGRVGIISPYAQQISVLREKFKVGACGTYGSFAVLNGAEPRVQWLCFPATPSHALKEMKCVALIFISSPLCCRRAWGSPGRKRLRLAPLMHSRAERRT